MFRNFVVLLLTVNSAFYLTTPTKAKHNPYCIMFPKLCSQTNLKVADNPELIPFESQALRTFK